MGRGQGRGQERRGGGTFPLSMPLLSRACPLRLHPSPAVRASLRKQATALKLPTLLHWYKPEPASQQLSWEQCQELGGEGVAPVALHFDGEGSQDRDKVVVVAGSVAVGPSKRSRH